MQVSGSERLHRARPLHPPGLRTPECYRRGECSFVLCKPRCGWISLTPAQPVPSLSHIKGLTFSFLPLSPNEPFFLPHRQLSPFSYTSFSSPFCLCLFPRFFPAKYAPSQNTVCQLACLYIKLLCLQKAISFLLLNYQNRLHHLKGTLMKNFKPIPPSTGKLFIQATCQA